MPGRRGLAIVSKDNDFRQLSFLKGSPPKVIWLCVGNAGTMHIARILERRREELDLFAQSLEECLFVLEEVTDE